MPALVLLSGFGPYENVERNPSGAIARRLPDEPPAGVEVRSVELPVSFDRAPRVWDGLVESVGERRPDLLVGLGAKRKPGFALERRARAGLDNGVRCDMDGVAARECALPAGGGDLESGLDLEALVEGLAGEGVADVRVSEDAGGYVCERFYHHLLGRAQRWGCPALFVHVPLLELVELERQCEIVRRLVALALQR